MAQIGSTFYLLASKIHWPPRERAIRRGLDAFTQLTEVSLCRLVDVGCGPGFLAELAMASGWAYWGIDPDPARIAHCRERWKSDLVRFSRGAAGTIDLRLNRNDVVVLNGVAHHLADDELNAILYQARTAGGLLVCDHFRQSNETGRVARWLQAADRGKFVREFDFFNRLPGFRMLGKELFEIGVGGVNLWPYFCLVYAAERKE